MLISLNWLREFVDIPESLDPRELGERFTITTAEVEEVVHLKPGDTTAAETVCEVEDWVIEVDNKSITHRPDLWGHYGIAREVAAMLRVDLKPLDVTDGERLDDAALPEIPITIDDAMRCPRYSGLAISGVKDQPSPSWMQARLAHVGIRPINALVDLTNYVMAEIGQPMHAFDGDVVKRIEVAVRAGGEKFTTLDGVERTLPPDAVMIQADRRDVALAGIMGGLHTEVGPQTKTILLESANFDAATIRRCATALGHRTEASARFEKSLDPALTVLAIARFVQLAEPMFPEVTLASRLSDCFPHPPEPLLVQVDPGFVSKFIGRNIAFAEMKSILEALEFKIEDGDDTIGVAVPSFRATKDIESEADIIEEIARFVGYGNIPPQLPQATLRRFLPNAQHQIERRTLELLCGGEGYFEIHDYNWYHEDWLAKLHYDPEPSVRLRNPAASGLTRMRHSLVPGLLHAAELNRRTWPAVRLLNIGSTFVPADSASDDIQLQQCRHLGLAAMTRGKKAADDLLVDIKQSLSRWARTLLDAVVSYRSAAPSAPWEESQRTVEILIGGEPVGRVSAINLETRRHIDEHFTAWSVVVAEVDLGRCGPVRAPQHRLLEVPPFPEVALDYSVLVNADRNYEQLVSGLQQFDHGLLRRLSLEGSYEGKNLPAGKRSLLLRARIGEATRTLQEDDIKGFASALETFITDHGLEIRR